jgi:hypothetical protein
MDFSRARKAQALLSALLMGGSLGVLGQAIGFVAFTEGKVTMVRGAAAYLAADGIRALEGDIFAVDEAGQAQVQLNEATIVNLGSGARLMLAAAPAARGAKGDTELALMAGWVKLTQKPNARNLRVFAPQVIAAFDGATAVVRAGPGSFEAFVESGVLRVSEIGDGGRVGAARTVKAGEFFAFRNRQASTAPRPVREFIEAMPRHFRDPLPSLPDKLKERRIEPKRQRDVTYAEVADWLKTSLPVRKGFVRRFASRTTDPQFRGGLVSHMREHPEWDRILFPEKYEAKDPAPTKGETAKP